MYRCGDRESPDSFVDSSGRRAIEYPKDFRSAAPLSAESLRRIPVWFQSLGNANRGSVPLALLFYRAAATKFSFDSAGFTNRGIVKQRLRLAALLHRSEGNPRRGNARRISNPPLRLIWLGGHRVATRDGTDHLCGLITKPRGGRLISELPPPVFPGFILKEIVQPLGNVR